MTKIRVGFGYDVHRLVEDRELWLGGIRLEYDKGLLGHSDADVLIHAICDALLGAANMRDIGYHFPDTAGEFENIDSKILLKKTVQLIATKGYRVGNIDATVCAERPKLNPHIPQMKQTLAAVMGVEEEAVKLAKFWGADPELARHAAILHDCTKYLGLEDQLHLCEKYGIELDSLERQAVKLLHSKTGACIAKYVFGEPDEVYEAIFWHTTGKADMTLLDKVLYMADYIEPNRDFDGVEELRKLAYTDLDQAMLLGVDSTIREMEERGYLIHTNTREARQWLLDQGVKLKE